MPHDESEAWCKTFQFTALLSKGVVLSSSYKDLSSQRITTKQVTRSIPSTCKIHYKINQVT